MRDMAEEKKIKIDESGIEIDEEDLKRRAKKLGLHTEDEAFMGKLERGLEAFSKVDSDDLLKALTEFGEGEK